jgi:hypothetical protein
LEEKQHLIAEILHIPVEDFEHISDIASQPTPDKDAKEVLLAALEQGWDSGHLSVFHKLHHFIYLVAKSLSDLVNASLTLSEEDTVVASSMATSQESRRLSSTNKVDAKFLRMQGPPTDKLLGISSNMNQHLTSLLVRPKSKS